MNQNRIFKVWLLVAMGTWLVLFWFGNSLAFAAAHWHYPAIMVLGAFVAGLTPEGGGAVAFPVLSVFFDIDRSVARDFSLMIQSVGMTSASLFILTRPSTIRKRFVPELWFVPVCLVGFVVGMQTLQGLPVYIIQALFLSLITAFAIAYARSSHRGTLDALEPQSRKDYALLVGVLFLGGMCASLFGTGSDILLYTVLVTRFRMTEKTATQMSIMLMAGMSILGFAYRHFIDAGLTPDQYRTWLCAYPVVLFMAPFGALVLHRMNIEWMIRGIVVLNIGQLAYFNLNKPSMEKMIASAVFFTVLVVAFTFFLAKMATAQEPNSAKMRVAP